MFEERKARKAQEEVKRKAKEEEALYSQELANWNFQIQGLESLLELVEGSAAPLGSSLILKKDERILGSLTNVGLVEMKSGPSQWKGSSQGFSIPIGSLGGRSVRYRVGASKGHMVKGEVRPTTTDSGSMDITNQRITFQGRQKSLECAYSKLLGIQHNDGSVTISVSNRQKPTVLYFGSGVDEYVTDRINIAMALFNGSEDETRSQLQSQIEDLKANEPKRLSS